MNLATIPAQAPFLDRLAQAWLDRHPDPAEGLLLLPTRRAARALAEAFLRATDGRPLLLPRIVALGAVDETPLALAGALDLPPSIEPAARHAGLARLILALPAEQGGARSLDAAWMLARDLASLMDEAERAEVDLHTALRAATPEAYAEHWQITLQFLSIVTRAWPDFLTATGLMNPAARQAALLRAQARAWEDSAPPGSIWAAGMTGATPAVVRLLKAVASLPRGLVILPGLDTDMPQPVWEELEPSHPQAGMARLLGDLGARREDADIWSAPESGSGRVALLSRALLPARWLRTWRDPALLDTSGITRLHPADQQEEAAAIALILRQAVETPATRAALITPDRALAARVATELRRWGVIADDSAGEHLAETPPAIFLRLLAATLTDSLGPVSLLAVLKHPLATAGLSSSACRALARQLERAALRGPRPRPGLTGLREAIEGKGEPIHDFLARIESRLEPALRVLSAVDIAPATLLATLIEAAEALAESDTEAGPARLWRLEEGEALAAALAAALPALESLPNQAPTVLPGLLDALLEGEAVRTRRALRAGADAEHPRIFIWGPLEARLQSVELAILGGLSEGVWPRATDPGPWMSRPMRANAGLPDPEEAIGQAAHDFVMAACAATQVVLSSPRRRDGAPAVPARWLERLDASLRGTVARLPSHPAAAWAAAVDQPAGPPNPVNPPRPTPAVDLRPRKLSVTEIETWIADPYAIHARHILRLRKLDPLEQATDAADYGTIVHAGLHRFFQQVGTTWPDDAAFRLHESMDLVLAAARLRPALQEWWRPRLHRIADWVATAEAARRAAAPPRALATELAGTWALDGIPRGFTLTGRADRIEIRPDGRLALLDYKTGTPPGAGEVEALTAPQLPLEAAMAAHGAFGEAFRAITGELAYWQLSGGHEPGKAVPLFKSNPDATAAAALEAESRLRTRVLAFDNPESPYLAQPHPGLIPRFPDYAQLARVAEWNLAAEDAE